MLGNVGGLLVQSELLVRSYRRYGTASKIYDTAIPERLRLDCEPQTLT